MPPNHAPADPSVGAPDLSVVICTLNPPRDRLIRVLLALRAQSYPSARWELIVVDNASEPPLTLADLAPFGSETSRLLREPTRGLTFARRTGALAARGEAIVFVDDDNVLAPDYLLQARAILDAHPDVGAGGGKSFGEFATPPACWHEEFFGLLAIRDLGPAPLLSPVRTVDLARDPYPRCAPIGAGMALRASAAAVWLNESAPYALPDRQGDALSSGGDNDIILTVLRSGWRVGYFPELTLTHLIPANRLESAYLARLNRAIQRSWMLVQYKHGINSWPHLTRATVPLRVAKSWIRHRAWSGPANRVRWFGARGHFEGRVKH